MTGRVTIKDFAELPACQAENVGPAYIADGERNEMCHAFRCDYCDLEFVHRSGKPPCPLAAAFKDITPPVDKT